MSTPLPNTVSPGFDRAQSLPRHIAIIMDGNGRWAQRRGRPRSFGHQAGQKALEKTVEHCGRLEIPILTIFAFSSENWQRPPSEVRRLLDLLLRALDRKVDELHENGARIRFIGELSAFSPELRRKMRRAEHLTRDNERLRFNIAMNYGGRWDMAQAARRIAVAVAEGRLDPGAVDESVVAAEMSLADMPAPDLLIRTGGEQRISNFLLWQAAYAEFYFTDTLWPDFGPDTLDQAIVAFQQRERRFGGVGLRAVKQA